MENNIEIINFFRSLNLTKLPDAVSNYIKDEIIADENIGFGSMEKFNLIKSKIELKYPQALRDESGNDVVISSQDYSNAIDALELLLEDADAKDKEDLMNTIEALKLMI